jgi:thiol-disulfide isomerase/thioredoxin
MPIELINIEEKTGTQKYSDDIKKITEHTNKIIVYMADWCIHCKKLKPEWDNFLRNLPTDDKLKKLDGMIVTASNLTTDDLTFDKLDGYPTIRHYGGSTIKNMSGPRTEKNIRDFVLKAFKSQSVAQTRGKKSKNVRIKRHRTKRRRTKRRRTKRRRTKRRRTKRRRTKRCASIKKHRK